MSISNLGRTAAIRWLSTGRGDESALASAPHPTHRVHVNFHGGIVQCLKCDAGLQSVRKLRTRCRKPRARMNRPPAQTMESPFEFESDVGSLWDCVQSTPLALNRVSSGLDDSQGTPLEEEGY